MYTFVLIVLVVSFISACFFKKKFWENRYLVLAIIAGVAIIATLSINYVTRNDKNTIVKTVWTKEAKLLNLESSLIDSNFIGTTDSLSLEGYYSQNDTIQSYYIIYNNGDENRIGFGYGRKIKSKCLDDIIIRDSNSDKAYYAKERIFYGDRNSPWVVELSLPHIKTYKCFYMPHEDYMKLKSNGFIKNE